MTERNPMTDKSADLERRIQAARRVHPAQTYTKKCRFCSQALEAGRDAGACRQCEIDIERAARMVL